jgi:hypothetical protein
MQEHARPEAWRVLSHIAPPANYEPVDQEQRDTENRKRDRNQYIVQRLEQWRKQEQDKKENTKDILECFADDLAKIHESESLHEGQLQILGDLIQQHLG